MIVFISCIGHVIAEKILDDGAEVYLFSSKVDIA